MPGERIRLRFLLSLSQRNMRRCVEWQQAGQSGVLDLAHHRPRDDKAHALIEAKSGGMVKSAGINAQAPSVVTPSLADGMSQ